MRDVFDEPPRVFDPTLLDTRTAALRDNQDVPMPNQGQARQRRIERLQTELSLIQGFISDCERIRQVLQNPSLDLVYVDALNMTLQNVQGMKTKAHTKGLQIHEELKLLRDMK